MPGACTCPVPAHARCLHMPRVQRAKIFNNVLNPWGHLNKKSWWSSFSFSKLGEGGRLFKKFLFWSWIYRTWQGCRKIETFNTGYSSKNFNMYNYLQLQNSDLFCYISSIEMPYHSLMAVLPPSNCSHHKRHRRSNRVQWRTECNAFHSFISSRMRYFNFCDDR
jgi:hypothetical protein